MCKRVFLRAKGLGRKAKAVVATGATAVALSAGNAFAANPLTTEATTQLGDLQADVVSLMTIMIGVVITMAIGGIIFSIVKKK